MCPFILNAVFPWSTILPSTVLIIASKVVFSPRLFLSSLTFTTAGAFVSVFVVFSLLLSYDFCKSPLLEFELVGSPAACLSELLYVLFL